MGLQNSVVGCHFETKSVSGAGIAGGIIFMKLLGVVCSSIIFLRVRSLVLVISLFLVQLRSSLKCPIWESGILKGELGANSIVLIFHVEEGMFKRTGPGDRLPIQAQNSVEKCGWSWESGEEWKSRFRCWKQDQLLMRHNLQSVKWRRRRKVTISKSSSSFNLFFKCRYRVVQLQVQSTRRVSCNATLHQE